MEKKEVVMADAQPQNEKLTYEQLENVCHQLSEQSRTLYQKLQEANISNIFRRLDYLFKVVEFKDAFIFADKEEFVNSCIDEIIAGMTIPEKSEQPAEKAEE